MAGTLLTMVMYHYVRPIAGSRYPGIKGLESKAFEGQLDYLERHYRIVWPEDVLGCLRDGKPLPERAALLTFDDGYKDHYRNVYPALRARGISGVFFPPTSAIMNRELLDVNRVHYILASAPDTGKLMREIEADMSDAKREFELEPLEAYRKAHMIANRFDGAEVIYIKRLLQHALPEALRARISGRLFARYVTPDEKSFGDELYASGDELREMASGGMEIGSHGHRHYWLGRLDAQSQAEDIDRSLAYLDSLGLRKQDFWFCYPYGSYNNDSLEILRDRGCAAAVATKAELSECVSGNALELPRLDTNDLPCDRDAALSAWTEKAMDRAAPMKMEKE